MWYEAGVSGLALSPDGRLAATAHGDGHVRLWEPSSGAQLATWRIGVGVAKDVAFTLDGAELMAVSAEQQEPLRVDLANLQTLPSHPVGTYRRLEALSYGGFLCLNYGPGPTLLDREGAFRKGYEVRSEEAPMDSQARADGKEVALLGRTGRLYRFDTPSRELREVAFDPDADAVALCGDTLIYGTRDRIIALEPEPRVLAYTSGQLVDLDANAQGDLIAAGEADGLVHLVRPDGTVAAELLAHSGRVSQVRFSEDGGTLVTASWDGRIRTWDLSALSADPAALLAEAEQRWGLRAGELMAD